jgi:hypothetical protein
MEFKGNFQAQIPQPYNIFEWKNKILFEYTKTLCQNLETFVNELANVVAYIFNLCPTKANACMIPYEKKLQSSQTWEYLNFWKSCSCTLAKDDIINKFGVISIPYTLVGCDSNYKIIQVVQ